MCYIRIYAHEYVYIYIYMYMHIYRFDHIAFGLFEDLCELSFIQDSMA